MTTFPRVSVIIPSFDCEKYLARCLRSILSQSIDSTDYEVILVDDGSTDKTLSVIQHFKDSIRYIRHETNRGLPASLNSGIKQANGKFVIRLDADDYVHRDYLHILSLFLELNHDMDAVACDYYEVDEREVILERKSVDECPIGCGIMFRMDQMVDIGMYDEDFLLHEDKELMKRFADKGYKTHRVPLPLYRYRRHQSNITNNEAGMNHYFQKLKTKHGLE